MSAVIPRAPAAWVLTGALVGLWLLQVQFGFDERGLVRAGAFHREFPVPPTWVLTAGWVHATNVDAVLNVGLTWAVARHVERSLGPARMGVVFVAGAMAGLAGAVFSQFEPYPSAWIANGSGGAWALLGACLETARPSNLRAAHLPYRPRTADALGLLAAFGVISAATGTWGAYVALPAGLTGTALASRSDRFDPPAIAVAAMPLLFGCAFAFVLFVAPPPRPNLARETIETVFQGRVEVDRPLFAPLGPAAHLVLTAEGIDARWTEEELPVPTSTVPLADLDGATPLSPGVCGPRCEAVEIRGAFGVRYVSLLRLGPYAVRTSIEVAPTASPAAHEWAVDHLDVRITPNGRAYVRALVAGHDPQDDPGYVATLEALHDVAPNDVTTLNDLAWALATSPVASLRDPARALPLALRAVELAPDDAAVVDTVAAAHAANGDFPLAIQRQVEAIALDQERDPGYRARLDAYLAGVAWWERE